MQAKADTQCDPSMPGETLCRFGRTPTYLTQRAAGQAVVCFLLYGAEVMRSVDGHEESIETGSLATYSQLPIPLNCRPDGGRPRRGNPAPVTNAAIIDAYGIVCHAGIVAEAMQTGISPEWSAIAGGFDAVQLARADADRQRFWALAKKLRQPIEADRSSIAYCLEAGRLVRQHWRAVDALGELLGELGVVNGDRVDELMWRCFDN